MKHAPDFLHRHRRLLLIVLLTVTLLVSSEANRRRLQEEAVVTSLPVTQTVPAVSAYAAQRNDAYLQEVAALDALVSQEGLDSRTRQSAAAQLQALVHHRECQQALEAALSVTALAPCAAVVTDGGVTLITAKQEITPEDSALVLTLAEIHAGASPSDVRIMTAE